MESMIEFNISPSAVSNSNGCLLLIISRTTAGYIYFGSQSYQLTDNKIMIANNTGRIIREANWLFLAKKNIQLISGSNFIAWHKNSLKDPLLSELASLILTLSFSLLKSNVCLKITGQNLSLSLWTIRCFDDLVVKPCSKNACSNKSVFLVLQGVVS